MQSSLRRNGTFGSSGSSYEETSVSRFKGKRNRNGSQQAEKPEKPKGAKECNAKMLKLVAMKDYTQASMREKLLNDGFKSEDVEHAIKLAVENRFIDDKRFAKTYVAHKSESGWGRGKIEKEIERYGIDQSILLDVFEDHFDDDGEVERAVRAIGKHHTSAKNEGDAHYRYLLNKGFSPSVCAKAMRIWRGSAE